MPIQRTTEPDYSPDANDHPVTRAWILENYRVRFTGVGTPFERSYIMNPGKFEGEPIFTPYFYELAMNGMGEPGPDNSDRFYVEPEDIQEFPELAGIITVELQYSDNGFVFCITCDANDLEYGKVN